MSLVGWRAWRRLAAAAGVGMSRGVVVALLGAESTGKTTLAAGLGRALAGRGRRVVVVGEACASSATARRARRGATSRRRSPPSRRGASMQPRRPREIVVADTTALMIAVYSDLVFGDTSLYPSAEAGQRRCDLTLLTALDLPWRADGLQRDGPQVRGPVDRRVRAALARAGVAFEPVRGEGDARLAAALAAVDRTLGGPP